MTTIYDYYELLISVDKDLSEPLQFISSFNKQQNLVKINFESGLFKDITFQQNAHHLELDEEDKAKIIQILELNLNQAIKKWIDFHLYNKEITLEIITNRI
jgi:hypothetical protein